jgi:hypothetical protein
VASVSRPPSGGGLLSGSRKLLAGLAVVALVLVGAIVKTIWFSSSASSGSAASPGGGGAAGPATSTSGGAGIHASGSGTTGSGTATPTGSDLTTSTSTSTSTGTSTGAAIGLVRADETVLAGTAPTVSVALVNTLATYAGGINAKDLATAYTAYSPAQQVKSPFATWSKGVQNSRISAVRIVSATGAVTALASGPVVIDATFVSHQPGSAGPVPGQTCTLWSLEYTMTPNADATGYLIDSARPSSGTGHAAC